MPKLPLSDGYCPECGSPHDWDNDSEATPLCFACQCEEAELRFKRAEARPPQEKKEDEDGTLL